MEDLYELDEENASNENVLNFTRDSMLMSETTDTINLKELVTELFVIPDTVPTEYNIK